MSAESIPFLTPLLFIVLVPLTSPFSPFPFAADVKRDRTRASHQAGHSHHHSSNSQQSTHTDGVGDRSRSIGGPTSGSGPGAPQGIPGSYRDANGIPRSMAIDQPVQPSFKASLDDGHGAYGTSYTNRKTKEYDLLNDIVKQTRNNFIDVSAKSGQLDEDDLIERGQKYVRNLHDIPSAATPTGLPNSANSNSFGIYYSTLELPQPHSHIVKRVSAIAPPTNSTSTLASNIAQTRLTGEVDYSALVQLMANATVQSVDMEFITSAAAQLSSTIIESTSVQEMAMPKITLAFEELDLLNDK